MLRTNVVKVTISLWQFSVTYIQYNMPTRVPPKPRGQNIHARSHAQN